MEMKNCYVCNKENLSKNEIGLTKKLLGRQVSRFYCIDCLANCLEITSEELLVSVEEFKSQGCVLFE